MLYLPEFNYISVRSIYFINACIYQFLKYTGNINVHIQFFLLQLCLNNICIKKPFGVHNKAIKKKKDNLPIASIFLVNIDACYSLKKKTQIFLQRSLLSKLSKYKRTEKLLSMNYVASLS